jgi:hypothetical protein
MPSISRYFVFYWCPASAHAVAAGKGFEVLHSHADALWALGSKLVPPAFSASEVFALGDEAAAAAAAAALGAVNLGASSSSVATSATPAVAETPAAAAAAAVAEGPEQDALLEQVFIHCGASISFV